MIEAVIVLLALLAVLGVGAALGILLINHRDATDARIAAMWRSMQLANQLHAAFWSARYQMRQEAERARQDEEEPPG